MLACYEGCSFGPYNLDCHEHGQIRAYCLVSRARRSVVCYGTNPAPLVLHYLCVTESAFHSNINDVVV